MPTLQSLLKRLWDDYIHTNPQSLKIFNLLQAHYQKIRNDHIALRTFNLPEVNLEVLSKTFLEFGYQEKDEYFFKEKKLRAKHFEHTIQELPKIFISELLTEMFSQDLQSIIKKIVGCIPSDRPKRGDFCVSGRSWEVSYPTYEFLRQESEYAAWMYVFGFRANHFTVSVQELSTFKNLEQLNLFLKQNGFHLNSNGGEIKGSPEVFLEQSSTLANDVPVIFQEGSYQIPGCYYEFAKRYKMPNGKLFQGFLEKSADKIFESTNKRN